MQVASARDGNEGVAGCAPAAAAWMSEAWMQPFDCMPSAAMLATQMPLKVSNHSTSQNPRLMVHSRCLSRNPLSRFAMSFFKKGMRAASLLFGFSVLNPQPGQMAKLSEQFTTRHHRSLELEDLVSLLLGECWQNQRASGKQTSMEATVVVTSPAAKPRRQASWKQWPHANA